MIKNLLLCLVTLYIYTASNIYAANDPIAGKNKSLICSACHGTAGISVNQQWPNLAGQHASYLIKELRDFKQGDLRSAPTMSPMTANLSEQDMADIAEYYSKQLPNNGKTPNEYLIRGEELYRKGDSNKHITACIACHGPDGHGNAEAGFPNLSGQQPLYTIQQLKAFKSGLRHNDMSSIMHNISDHMNNEDMTAVAYYLLGIAPK